MKLLEQMEAAIVSTVRETEPSVVTIEGKIPLPKLKLRRLHAGAVRRAGRQSGTDVKEADRTAQEAMRTAEKTLEEVRKRIQVFGGVPVTGSGFLLRGGLVVTTAEVIRSVREPVVVLADGKRIAADWVNPDPDTNLAVLHISGIDPQLGLRWGDSSRVFPGSFVLTIGNQAGFANTYAPGSVAAVGRSGRSGALRYTNLIQFTGTVGGGGSGGPLLNIRGEVVGMIVATPANAVGLRFAPPAVPGSMEMGRTLDDMFGSLPAAFHAPATMILVGQETQGEDDEGDMDPEPDQGKSRRPERDTTEDTPEAPMPPMPPFGGMANTGFALPSNDIRPLVDLLSKRASPAFRPGWLGVKLSATDGSAPGALVAEVYIGGPADKAGLRPGDILVAVNGQTVTKDHDIHGMVGHLNAGDTLEIKILRGTTRRTLHLDIDARPDEDLIHKMPARKRTPQTSAVPSAACPARQTV
jgi:serine protease Do